MRLSCADLIVNRNDYLTLNVTTLTFSQGTRWISINSRHFWK